MVVLAGILIYPKLVVREYPDITAPVVSVSTNYAGASAEIVETEVTRVIEDSIAGISGLDFIQSSSSNGHSDIVLTFKSSQNIDAVTNDVRDNISRIKSLLPEDADDSIVSKTAADSHAIAWISLSSDQHSLMQLSEIVEQTVKDKLEILPGVARVFVVGARSPAMHIRIDPAKLAAFGMTVHDITQAIEGQNLALPSGTISASTTEFTIYSKTNLKTEKDFKQIVLKEKDGFWIRLEDVAVVEIAPRSEQFLARFNGKPTIGLGLVKQSTANPLDISKEMHKVVPMISKGLPEGVDMVVAYDATKIIKESIHAVHKTIVEAIILVVLIIFIFLRTFSATLIPIVTIPISLIGGLVMIHLFGFTINLLTLLAMVLAIGLVVDDAIVVLENIYRHIEEGMQPLEAGFLGMKEIGGPVIAMTLTLAAVFAPIAFMGGKIGQLFTEFAVVLAGCVFISGFTALTLSPVMSARLLKKEKKHGKIYNTIEAVLTGLTNLYKRSLIFCLRWRKVILIVFVAIFITNGLLFKGLKSEMTPMEDRGFAIIVGMAKEGALIDFTTKYGKQFEQVLDNVEDVKDYFLIVGYPNVRQALAFCILKDRQIRAKSQFEVVDEINQNLFGLPGLMSFAINPPSSLADNVLESGISVVVQYPGTFEELGDIVHKVMASARTNKNLMNLDTDLKTNKPQIEIKVNREKAAASGVKIAEISQTLQVLMGGKVVTHFEKGAKQYDVYVKSDKLFRHQLEDIYDIKVQSNRGLVPLVDFIEAKEMTVATSLNRFNKLPSATITASLAPDYSLDDAIAYFNQTIHEVSPNAGIDFTGATRLYLSSSTSIYLTFLIALLVVFLVLAAQFESFIQPFIIMLSVPMAVFGGLLTMYFHGGSLNVYSQIGFITLIGLITKHGILIVEFAKQLREKSIPLEEAIITAASLRFRPILMTTMATICGCIPLALAVGAGSESRAEIGWVIVGGMSIGTIFTLYVVPVVIRFLGKERA